MIRIVFLDFDGVLNSTDWYKRRPNKVEWAARLGISEEQFWNDRFEWALRSIDPDAVAALNDLVTKTQARVVISSTWRTMWSLPKLEKILRWFGFAHHLVGATPDQCEQVDGGLFVGARRGNEIAAWLTTMFGAVRPADVEFVIIDDDSDMGPLCDRLFNTSHDVGLRVGDVEAIAAMFEVA